MDIGERIVHLREKKHWSQRELANRSGLNSSVMNRIEKGKRPLTDHELRIFADLFNVSTDFLLGISSDTSKENNHVGQNQEENLFFFDIDGLSDEDIEEIKRHIEFLKFKAKQEGQDK